MGLVGSLVVVGLAVTMAAGALAPTLVLAAFWFTLSGALGSAVGVIFTTLVQLRAPDEHRGGIMGLVSLAIFGVAPLGYAVAGAVGTAAPARGASNSLAPPASPPSGVLGLASKAMREA